jgi:phosphosulfolactate synthase (CoM biosynthesis protein A)
MPRRAVKALIDLCHSYDVKVDTGGYEHVLTLRAKAVDQYMRSASALN